MNNIRFTDSGHRYVGYTLADGSFHNPPAEKFAEDNPGITPADYAAPPATWDTVRGERNQLLKDTDWQASSDRTMSDAETVYRQALRDLPAQDVGPGDVVWPSAP